MHRHYVQDSAGCSSCMQSSVASHKRLSRFAPRMGAGARQSSSSNAAPGQVLGTVSAAEAAVTGMEHLPRVRRPLGLSNTSIRHPSCRSTWSTCTAPAQARAASAVKAASHGCMAQQQPAPCSALAEASSDCRSDAGSATAEVKHTAPATAAMRQPHGGCQHTPHSLLDGLLWNVGDPPGHACMERPASADSAAAATQHTLPDCRCGVKSLTASKRCLHERQVPWEPQAG